MSNEDQVDDSAGQTGAEGADQDAQEHQQSSGDDKASEKTYDYLDKKGLTADELHEEVKASQGSYTRMSQENKQMKEKLETFESGARATKATQDVAQTQNVSPEIREAIMGVVGPEIDARVSQITKARDQQAYWDSSFKTLEQTYDGREGKPKFSDTDRQAIIDEMRNPSNRIYDPEVLYEKLHKAEIRDFEVKQALRKQKGTTRTEKTGAATTREPDKKSAPKSISEASERLFKRLG